MLPWMKRRYCKHVMCRTCMQQCSQCLSCHRRERLCATKLKYHHSAATPHHHRRCWCSCRTHENCMQAKQIIIIFYIFYFLLYLIHGLKNNTRLTRIFNPTKKKNIWWRNCQSANGGISVLCLTNSRNAFVSRCIWLKLSQYGVNRYLWFYKFPKNSEMCRVGCVF